MSINGMVRRVAGLLGTRDLTAWQERFVQSLVDQTCSGADTSSVTEKQFDVLEQIYNRHFSG